MTWEPYAKLGGFMLVMFVVVETLQWLAARWWAKWRQRREWRKYRLEDDVVLPPTHYNCRSSMAPMTEYSASPDPRMPKTREPLSPRDVRRPDGSKVGPELRLGNILDASVTTPAVDMVYDASAANGAGGYRSETPEEKAQRRIARALHPMPSDERKRTRCRDEEES